MQEGVIEGRKIFGNITKYIKMGASSNFGNMFSVLGASIFLPFLPMAPIQVLTNNLLYDFSQTAIPTDNVDEEYIAAPRRWDIGNIFKFMVFIGPISSIFDYATYGDDALCVRRLEQSAAVPDRLVRRIASDADAHHPHHPHRQDSVHRKPSQSGADRQPRSSSALVGIALPFTWAGAALGFMPLPRLYWPLVAAMLLSYAVLTHLVKQWFVRRWGM